MITRFKFFKLYSKHKEGYIIDSIITFDKREILTRFGQCIQWDNRLRINLWIVEIEFGWVSKLTTNK